MQMQTFVWLKKARAYFLDEMASVVTPLHTFGVGATVETPAAFCSPACYNPTTRHIYIRQLSQATTFFDTVLHEYGHHVVNLYGGLNSPYCLVGSAESDQLNESLADIFTLMVVQEEANAGYNYSYFRIAGNTVGAPSQHSNTQVALSHANATCTADVHRYGAFFEQAIWEVLNNFDCGLAVCNSSSGFGTNIGFASREQARDRIGEAIAYALLVTPSSTTYRTFAANMWIKLLGSTNFSTAQNFRQVLAHHGLTF